MPVHLEWVKSPSDQDWSDLDKLYQDVPDTWYAASAANHSKEYIEQHLNQEDWHLAVGRFNDRLIAAASVRLCSDGYEICDVCVRKITRSRGVAHQLLIRITQWADSQQKTLVIKDNQKDLTKLKGYDFVKKADLWIRGFKA